MQKSAAALFSRLADARAQTDRLFDILVPGAFYERPIPERHRIIFYLGHLEAFDWNLLADRLLPLKPVEPAFDRLFAFGIDPVEGKLPDDAPGDWPTLDQVHAYVQRNRDRIDQALSGLGPAEPCGPGDPSPVNLLNAAIEHRLMHAETFAYMAHRLPHRLKQSQPGEDPADAAPVESGMAQIPAGRVAMGRMGDGFGWDNEYAPYVTAVPAFEIDRCKITNREFLEFMAAGGYENPGLWPAADWEWKTAQQVAHPAFWKRRDDGWSYRGMFAEFPLPMDWPVYVSQAEASAYARWRGKALPTEAEWQRAAYGGSDGDAPGNGGSGTLPGNLDFRRWNPVPVHGPAGGHAPFGLRGMIGNGWEWTSTLFAPFPGFQPFSFYPGYSADFFDSRHYVLKGASARTAACLARPSFRNWFQPHYPYVYSGFRCVRR